MTKKGHRVLRGRRDLLHEPRIYAHLFGQLNYFMVQKGHRVIKGRPDQLNDPKGHRDLFGRFNLVDESKKSLGH